MAFLSNKNLFQRYVVPQALKYTTKVEQSQILSFGTNIINVNPIARQQNQLNLNRPRRTCTVNMIHRFTSSNASSNQLTFLDEANKFLNKTSDSVSNKEDCNSECSVEGENKNIIQIDAAKNRKDLNSKASKKRKKILHRNVFKPSINIEKTSSYKKNEMKFIQNEPLLSFKYILEQNNAMADKFKQNDLEANKVFDKAASFYETKREAELQFRKRTPEYAIDWNSAMAMVKETESQLPSMIPSRDDLDEIQIAKPTFNIAKIIHDFPTLQRLVDLGVELSTWESYDRDGKNMEIAMRLNFEEDVKPRINWLLDNGIDLENQGEIFTRTPEIFNKSLEELNKMVEYLQSKKFTNQSIRDIIVKTKGLWLKHTVVEIDTNLGFFQKKFELSGNQVRLLANEGPNLIIWSGVPFQVNLNHITIVDGMGFTHDESKQLLINCPELYKFKVELALQSSFDMCHRTMGLSHETILQNPFILTKKSLFIKSRHLFLKKLGRDQYNPKKPNYVSPKVFCEENDADFCELGARVPVELYNKFLMTI